MVSERGESLSGRDVAKAYEEKWSKVKVIALGKETASVSGEHGTYTLLREEVYEQLYKHAILPLVPSHVSSVKTISTETDSYVPSAGEFNEDKLGSFLPSSVTSSPSKTGTWESPSDLSHAGLSGVSTTATLVENVTFTNMVRNFVAGLPDMLKWLSERIKLHKSWKPLVWSPETNINFPERFKRVVRMFMLDSSKQGHKQRAMFLVFEHMSKKLMLYKTD